MEEKIVVQNAAEESPIEAAANEAQETENAPQAPEAPSAKKGGFGKFLKNCFSKKNIVKTVAVLVVMALLIGGGLFYLNYNSPKSIAQRYAVAVIDNDLDVLARLSAYDYKAYTIGNYSEDYFYRTESDRYDEDIDSWNDYCKVIKEYRHESFENIYGKYKVTAEVTREKDHSVKKLLASVSSSRLSRAENYGLDTDEISAGKEYTVKIKIDGEDDNEKDTATIYLAKINGSWKVLSEAFN